LETASVGLAVIIRSNLEKSAATYGSLKLDEVWDPLRGNPRFEKIVASLAPKPAGK
jgi:hypothetical protein